MRYFFMVSEANIFSTTPVCLFVCFICPLKHIVIHDIKNTDVGQYTNRHSLRLYNYYHRNFWTLTCNTSQYITPEYELVMPGYDIIRTKAWTTLGHCRLVALVREGLHLDIMDSWMDSQISSIWFKISCRGVKPLYIAAIYREHSILNQQITTDSEQLQKKRWKVFVDQWCKSSQKAYCIIVGDKKN